MRRTSFSLVAGLRLYGALASRIGKPADIAPKALDKIWNFDAVQQSAEDYKKATLKVRELYITAYPDGATRLSPPSDIASFVDELVALHPALSPVRFWRVLVASVVHRLDLEYQGQFVEFLRARQCVTSLRR